MQGDPKVIWPLQCDLRMEQGARATICDCM
jgi:hypothetical protein